MQEKVNESNSVHCELAAMQEAIFNALPAHIALLNSEGVICAVNEAWRRFATANFLQGPQFGLGQNYLEVCERAVGDCSDEARLVSRGVRQVLAGEAREFCLEYPCHSPEEKRWFRLIVTPLQEGEKGGAVVMHANITERRLAEEALRESETRLRTIFESEPQCVKFMSPEGKLLEINPAGLKMIDAESYSDAFTKPVHEFVHPEDRGSYLEHFERVKNGEMAWLQFRLISLIGKVRWMEAQSTPILNDDGTLKAVISVSRDITERKVAEQRVRRLNQLYAVSSGINEAIVRLDVMLDLYKEACRIAVERGGLLMAWVGMPNAEQSFEPVAMHGRDEGYLNAIRLCTMDDTAEGCGPAGIAFRTMQPSWCNDIERDSGMMYYKAEALERGYKSCAAFPLESKGKSFGVFVVYADHADYFDEEEIQLLSGLADNLSFATESQEREARRIRIEAELRASEQNMAIAQKIAHFGSWEMDLSNRSDVDSNWLRWSDEMFRIAGFEPGKVQVSNELFFSLVPPEEHQMIRQAVAFAIKNRTQYLTVHRIIRPNGEERIVREIAQAFYDEKTGLPLKMIGTAHDITEQRRAEEALRFQAHLLNVAREAILVKDLEDRIIYWNKGAERIYGWTEEEVLGKKAGELLYKDLNVLQQAWTGLHAHGMWEGEVIKRTKDEREIIVEARWTLIRDENGGPKSIMSVTNDVTEKKKLEAKFLRAQRMESIGTLAGGIAHDLNNILAPILMSVELLQAHVPNNEESHSLLSTVRNSAQRGADLVKQVLSFARGVEGKKMTINPLHILRDIQVIIRDTFPKNITFHLDSEHDLWTVTGDPTQLHQVLMNLCVNARDAMPNGGQLSVSLKNIVLDDVYAGMNPDSVAGSYLLIQVSDTGVGIPPGIREKIFDPFFTTKDIGRGTGLGLSTVLALVKSHGGFISVYSEVGKGSKFKVYLPASAVEETIESTIVEQSQLPRGNSELVLVVDDEESVRLIAKKSLERFGYRVLLAANGAEAVSSYVRMEKEIAVVLTDMAMPIMDGLATIVALKSINPKVKIIGSSGLASNGGIARAMGAGVQHFIPKPYTAEALLKTMRQVLENND
ncbi:MAG: PAS domain S-box protein [Verrucomicrobiota bacterium]|nr:PAS domain S-box protein [Verrucomicrobiota bacterium]